MESNVPLLFRTASGFFGLGLDLWAEGAATAFSRKEMEGRGGSRSLRIPPQDGQKEEGKR